MFSSIAIAGALFALAYYGAQLVLGPPLDIPECNYNIQSFDLRAATIYWQVQEGRCAIHDADFEMVRANVEELVKERPESEWPAAECSYAHLGDVGFVFVFGTDYYDVEDMDCIEPLRQLQKEKEDNTDLMTYIKEKLSPVKQKGLLDTGSIVDFLT